MGGQIQPTKTEKILLILTLGFLSLMLTLLLHARAVGIEGSYTVETERSAAASDALPEEPPAVNLNAAGPEELATLPGIGEKLAERIVRYREENGGFQTVDELLNVSGIGEGKLAALREYVCVG